MQDDDDEDRNDHPAPHPATALPLPVPSSLTRSLIFSANCCEDRARTRDDAALKISRSEARDDFVLDDLLGRNVWQRAFQNNEGGRAAAVAVTLFVLVIVVSVVQFQLLRLAGGRRR